MTADRASRLAASGDTLAAVAERVAAARAGAIAFTESGRRLTFEQAGSLAGRLAGHLRAMGVGPGDVVSWLLPNWWEAAIVHHAILRAGALPNPLNPIFRAAELEFVLGEARPRVLIVPARWRGYDYASVAATLAPRLGVDHLVVARGSVPGALELDALLDEPSPPPPLAGSPDDVALLLYTSGTTSDPKGVLHSHRTLLYEIATLRDIHAIEPADCYLGGSPAGHIAGLVYGILMPMTLGTRTALLERWDPGAALETIEREGATFQTGAPTFLQGLGEHPDAARRNLSTFRLFSTGGARIAAEAIREAGTRLGCVVKRAYGSTEAPTLTATTMDDSEAARVETDGRPIADAIVRVVGGDGGDVAAGEEGEIVARSPEIFLGYRNSALDAAAFDAGGWYRTGDLGRIDSSGYLRVTGRLKDVIIRGGENISAKEIEDLLGAHPAVAEAAVVGIPDPLLGERVCAFVEVRDGHRISFEEMSAYLLDRQIARQKIPERLEVRERLPRTASGKVRKTELRAEVERA